MCYKYARNKVFYQILSPGIYSNSISLQYLISVYSKQLSRLFNPHPLGLYFYSPHLNVITTASLIQDYKERRQL